jgi:chemotaxis protein CheY-P-specific phosphatase CheC
MPEANSIKLDSLDFYAAANDVARALSSLTNIRFATKKECLTKQDLCLLPSLVSDRSQAMAASFFEVCGDLEGYALVLMPQDYLDSLMEILIGKRHVEEELANSVIGEIGNILASTFVSNLADQHYLKMVPTPPQVAVDMVGAVLEAVAVNAAGESEYSSDDVPIVFMEYAGLDHELTLIFIWVAKI